MYAKKPGVGIEPTYSGSAGRRLNRSATPATTIKKIKTVINVVCLSDRIDRSRSIWQFFCLLILVFSIIWLEALKVVCSQFDPRNSDNVEYSRDKR